MHTLGNLAFLAFLAIKGIRILPRPQLSTSRHSRWRIMNAAILVRGDMDWTRDRQVLELESFEPARWVAPNQRADIRRRFCTLFRTPEAPVHAGGNGLVYQVASHAGDSLALKVLDVEAVATPHAQMELTVAFQEEYRHHLLVSGLQGFPHLFGFGAVGERPAIVMQWVEGVSLRDFLDMRKRAGAPIPATMVAAIGSAVLEALDNAARLDPPVIHRDLSPSNIMLCGDPSRWSKGHDSEIAVRLIDFGCAIQVEPDDYSFTPPLRIWHRGTPEYAAPEMLLEQSDDAQGLRRSRAVDVFALCSVLYELYAGHTPWRVSDHPETPSWQLKCAQPAEIITPRQPEDAVLVQSIMHGLAPNPNDRPTPSALAASLCGIAG